MRVSRFTAEFKAEAIKQIIDRGHSVVDVSKRLGVQSTKAGEVQFMYSSEENSRCQALHQARKAAQSDNSAVGLPNEELSN
jgi:hypothetical protein